MQLIEHLSKYFRFQAGLPLCPFHSPEQTQLVYEPDLD